MFRPVTADIPPARGRRRLDLTGPEGAVTRTPGTDDRMESAAPGAWALDGRSLTIDAPVWSGTYDIEAVTDDVLILRPRKPSDNDSK